MAIQQYRTHYRRLSADDLAAWQGVAPAIVGDCMNRGQVMAARIKPLWPGIALIGQARTVTCMVGDNAAIHVAIGLCAPGEVLVVDARGHVDTAVWGGIELSGEAQAYADAVWRWPDMQTWLDLANDEEWTIDIEVP